MSTACEQEVSGGPRTGCHGKIDIEPITSSTLVVCGIYLYEYPYVSKQRRLLDRVLGPFQGKSDF